jgi:hypothetical protein
LLLHAVAVGWHWGFVQQRLRLRRRWSLLPSCLLYTQQLPPQLLVVVPQLLADQLPMGSPPALPLPPPPRHHHPAAAAAAAAAAEPHLFLQQELLVVHRHCLQPTTSDAHRIEVIIRHASGAGQVNNQHAT